MTPYKFVAKWRGVELKERSASQSHFNDLCRLLDEADPVTADRAGEWFTFEKGASKTSGGEGWADVWRQGCFAWEYKGRRANLDAAFSQLLNYSVALENPPLLIVSDMDVIRVHTNWTNTVQQVHIIALDELLDGGKRDILKAAFTDPEKLRPAKTRQVLTEEAAEKFVNLAQRLRDRGHDADTVAHFVNRLVFCMFAEDVGLLPSRMFQRMLEHSASNPHDFETHARTLFAAMKDGGAVGFERVEWFNGGLFDTHEALRLDRTDIAEVISAARLDWSDIDPSILGTLFERGLDPSKRSQLGAHYTDRDKIMLIVNPVIVEPLTTEWGETRGEIKKLIESAPMQTEEKLLRGSDLAKRTTALNKAAVLHRAFIDRLKAFRVLDPACGSGNFLYLSLLAIKDLEHRANLEAEALGLSRGFPTVGPECVNGIEINPFAAELARISVWIGEIQWMRRNGFEAARNPILRPLGTIECRDAILNEDGTRAEWPRANVVIGNPPFLGDRKMKPELGEDYTDALRAAFDGEVRRGADLVCFWFAKAWSQIKLGALERAGLVSTNSIRGGANREVLKPIVAEGRIFDAWNDEEWTVEGAAVRVSLICFDGIQEPTAVLDAVKVERVFSDLTASTSGIDITLSKVLLTNENIAFQGTISYGPFEISDEDAREMLRAPSNPDGSRNIDVVRPWTNGRDITRRPENRWIIFFPPDSTEADVSLYERPFAYVSDRVRPYRADRDNADLNRFWWRLWRSRPEMFAALRHLRRVMITPRVSKHRLFVWRDSAVVADSATVAIARDDDTTFGILHSWFHEIWSLRMGTWLGKGNDPR